MNMCLMFLVASRKVATNSGNRTDTGCAVLGDSSWYFVEDSDGVIVWEGDAHCKYCARSEAISRMADTGTQS